jgi:hypothetical protein
LLPQLRAEIPWRLILPTVDGEAIILNVPATLLEEWQTVASQH